MPTLNRATRGASRVGAILTAFFLVAMLLPGAVLATNSVVPASNTALSADTNSVDGSGAWTPITGPQVNGTGGTLDDGTVVFTIADAGEFAFNPGVGSASLSGGVGCGTLAVNPAVPTVVAASVTVNLTGDSSGACTLNVAGLQVRPTAAGGTPLETSLIDTSGTAGVTGTAGTLSVVPGAAILTFQVAPSPTSVVAHANFATSPTIRSKDQFNNLRTGDSIALATVPAASGLGCAANPVLTAAGDAAFTNCHIDTAGSFVLRATGAGTSVDYGTAITVNPAAASKIVFTTQPTRGTTTSILSPQPVVAIQDTYGNTVPTSATVTITKSGGSGSLLNCGPFPTTTGVVTGSSCRIDAVGTGYTLIATGGGFTSAATSPFDISDRLVFTTQPSGAVAGVAFLTQPVVEVRAGASIRSLNDSSTPVTLSINTGPSGATLTCSPNPVTASAGIATFAGSACRLDKVGTYTLLASGPGLSSATSSNFSVAAGPATKLAFTSQPNAATTAQAFPIQPVVAVQDAGGNTVTTGAYSTASVTLAIGTNPAAGTLTCTGGLTKNAVSGVATFSGCQINNAGAGYTLTASASGLTGATSTAFTVSAPAASITLTTSAPISPGGLPTITWGGGIILTTQFGANGGTKTFKMQATRDNVTWFDIGPLLTTDAAGRATFVFRPSTNFFYRAVFAGTPDLQAGTSNSVRTVVRQIALLRPTNGGSVKTINRNTSVTFFTVVRPARPELTPARVTFSFYRLSGSTWVLSTQRTVTAAADGRAATTFTFSSSGQWYVRSMANPTTYNANSVMSSIERYSVN